jgi:hypothetical protein
MPVWGRLYMPLGPSVLRGRGGEVPPSSEVHPHQEKAAAAAESLPTSRRLHKTTYSTTQASTLAGVLIPGTKLGVER